MNNSRLATVSVLHRLPGRVRLALPAHRPDCWRQLERRLRRFGWVQRAEVNPWTGNLLVTFDRDVPLTFLLAAVEAELIATADPMKPVLLCARRGQSPEGWRLAASATGLLAGGNGLLAAGVMELARALVRQGLILFGWPAAAEVGSFLVQALAAAVAGGPLALAATGAELLLRLASGAGESAAVLAIPKPSAA